MKVCAAGFLLRDNKMLLGKRSADLKFYPDVWDAVGGHCGKNETLEQALTRELREEIGVTPTRFIHFAVLHDPKPDIHGDYEYHIYLVTGWIGAPRNLSPSEHSELHWFEINEALKLNLAHPQYPELFRRIGEYMEEARHDYLAPTPYRPKRVPRLVGQDRRESFSPCPNQNTNC